MHSPDALVVKELQLSQVETSPAPSLLVALLLRLGPVPLPFWDPGPLLTMVMPMPAGPLLPLIQQH